MKIELAVSWTGLKMGRSAGHQPCCAKACKMQALMGRVDPPNMEARGMAHNMMDHTSVGFLIDRPAKFFFFFIIFLICRSCQLTNFPMRPRHGPHANTVHSQLTVALIIIHILISFSFLQDKCCLKRKQAWGQTPSIRYLPIKYLFSCVQEKPIFH